MSRLTKFLKKLSNYIKTRLYINETVILYSLNNHLHQKSVANIKHATNEKISDILYFQHERYIDIFKNFLTLDDKGYLAYLENNCIHRSWVKLNEQIVYPHWASPYKLKKDEIYIHYCETAPEARGKNIYPHVLSNIIEEHQDKEILISVNEKNIGSIKGVEKVGFKKRESKSTCDTRDEVYQKNYKRELKVMIITMSLSRIVQPIVNLHNVVGVIECAPRKTKQTNRGMLYKIAKKLYSFVNKEAKTLKSFTKDKNIPYYYMDNGSDEPLENWVKNISPDVIVVYSMSQLLKRNIFDIPTYGTINLHPALLPSYKGPFPDFWMYYNTEKKGGVTVHYIDEGEDTGDIIYQEEYDIPLGMKSPDMLNLSVGKIGTNLLLKALNNIEDLPRQKQSKESSTPRARNLNADEHTSIIDWNTWEIEKIWHLLRGTQLWLNAVAQPRGFYKGHRWLVEEFEKCETSNYEPSQVYKENGKYFIACRDGRIYLDLNFSLKNFVLSVVR